MSAKPAAIGVERNDIKLTLPRRWTDQPADPYGFDRSVLPEEGKNAASFFLADWISWPCNCQTSSMVFNISESSFLALARLFGIVINLNFRFRFCVKSFA